MEFYMYNNITIQELFDLNQQGAQTVVDVRSPKEFNDMTIPGSINIPVFNDTERAEVGTLYKQVGKEEAMERGLAIFSAKLPDFIHTFKQINTPITIFCWRGGMRSQAAATVLELMNVHVNRLSGGVRSYRQWVLSELDKQEFPPHLYILNGHTGIGKTLILKSLHENGYPIIDLEGMANHRGSIFGHIGRRPNNQKTFESLLVQKMLQYAHMPYIILEGESKRIGKASLPEFLYKKKELGTQIFIQVPIEERVSNILQDYQPWKYPEAFKEAFYLIKKRIPFSVARDMEASLQNAQYPTTVKLLLEHYYDPRYEYTEKHLLSNDVYRIEADSTKGAAKKVQKLIDKLEGNDS